MNEIQQKLDNELINLENIMNKIDYIDDNEFNNIYVKLKNYENNISKINITIKKILLIKDNLNIVINDHILKKINKKTKIYSDNKSKSLNTKLNKKSNTANTINTINTINSNITNTNKAKETNKEPRCDSSTQSKKDNFKINYKNVTNNDKYNNYSFTKFAVINIFEKDLEYIENAPIYYINETEQYCIKINNNLIMGNIANIYDSSKQTVKTKVNKCKNTNCTGLFYNKLCNYYHDDEYRNFTNYSWNHLFKNKLGQYNLKNNTLNIKKYDQDNTRFIGSLDTLMEDLPFSSVNEKKLRSNQLIHDILLFMILSEYLN